MPIMNDKTLSPDTDHHDINRIKNSLLRRNRCRPGRNSAFAGIENASFACEIKSAFAGAGSMSSFAAEIYLCRKRETLVTR